MPRYSLRLAAAGIVAIATALALLRNPTPGAMMFASTLLVASLLLSTCLAIGCSQPIRSLWVGFLVATVGSLWLNYGDIPKKWGIPAILTEWGGWLDGQLEWSTARGTPRSTEYYVDKVRLYSFRFDSEGLLVQEDQKRITTASDEELAKALPLETRQGVTAPGIFRSIFTKLFAIFSGCIGGWVTWAARTRSMRSAAGTDQSH